MQSRRYRWRRWVLAVSAIVGIAACRVGPTSIALDPTLIDGYWVKDATMDGSSESWMLTLSGDSVTGMGGWKGDLESGQIALGGTIDGDSLHLRIRYFSGQATPDSLPRFSTRFDGTLISRSELSGTQRTPVTPPSRVRLYKTHLVWVPGSDRS